jgi:hypothetical protein
MTCTVHQKILSDRPAPVTVNGVPIARDAIAREAQHHPAPKPIAAWRAAAQALVIRELLLQEARRTGVEASPIGDGEDRRETEEEATIRALIERDVEIPAADLETCRRYYEGNRKRFQSPEGAVAPFEAVALKITTYLHARALRTALAQYVARLVLGATITGVELPGAQAHRVH